jgi:hypothetical protein
MADPRGQLPACGLYRTTEAIGDVPAGRLVYFHNHGDPGPGIYTPHDWKGNRARFHERGHPLASPTQARSLQPLAVEGFYRIVSAFFCCEKRCRRFEPETLVQLGYDGAATPLLFVPELHADAIALPEHGTKIDPDLIERLGRLQVAGDVPTTPGDPDRLLH